MKSPKRLSVVVSDDVKSQILQQVLYISKDSIDNALAWEDRVQAAIMGLGDFHNHAADDAASERAGIRLRKVIFERTYLIHYRVDTDAGIVEVMNFRHGARLPRHGEP